MTPVAVSKISMNNNIVVSQGDSYTPNEYGRIAVTNIPSGYVPFAVASTDRAGWMYSLSTQHYVGSTRTFYARFFGSDGSTMTGDIRVNFFCIKG